MDPSTNHFRYVWEKDELYLNDRLCTLKSKLSQGKSKTVLYNEPGGIAYEHWKRWQALAQSGNDVEIRGPCVSGFTLIMAQVPSDKLCFGEASSLQFHMARNSGYPVHAVDDQSIPTRYSYVDQRQRRGWENDDCATLDAGCHAIMDHGLSQM